MTAVVIINKHEPEGEVAARLLELAQEKDYNPSVVVAQRGEHDAGLSFRVPDDVADAFIADRANWWPVPEDEAPAEDDTNTTPVRTRRPGKAESDKG